MFARSMTIHGNPAALRDGIAYIHDTAMPAFLEMAGCTGLSMLVDRPSGRSIVTTGWRSADDLQASSSAVRPLWSRSIEVMGGLAEINEWEIAVLHRHHGTAEGAASRVTWLRARPRRIPEVVDAFRMALVPQLDELPGFCSVSLLCDSTSGRLASAVTVDDRDALAHTRGQNRAIRQSFVEQLGVDVTDMAEFDLVLAHLHVPETV